MYYPAKEEFLKLSEDANIIPVYKEIVADMETPVSAFKKLKGEGYSYLLESVEQGQKIGRYSFIGIDYHAIVSSKDGQLVVKDSSGKILKSKDTENPLQDLKDILSKYQSVEVEGLPLFYGGAVGYLGYDVVKYFENIPQDNEDDLVLPEMNFILSDTLVIFDHLHHSIKVVTNVKVSDNLESDYRLAKEKIDKIITKLDTPLKEESRSEVKEKKLKFKSNISKEEFMKNVEKAKDYIREGDIFQVVLSQRLEVPITAGSFDIYRQLRRVNPSPYMYYLDFVDFEIVGSSPELLVRVEDGVIENRPIAGTRKRGKDSQEDRELAQDLLGDEKERAEHIMLVDLGRNDIGKVSEYGSVEVSRLMEIEYYSHVMHIVSDVQGKLKNDEDIYSGLQSCFPAGTLSGAPKIRAMEIIDELENTRRGPYGGSIGYFGYSGNLDSCITIRTMVIKDKKAYVQAGAGIVADSDPEFEYQETLNKAQALLEAVRLAEGGVY
ncbi:anthranilate synthase component I [Orenia metallireducens]|uniref:Anthranilate synthase component 1 n=1 Tax=Orenia metallireducens TaxID=1413210 RepID=A0A285HCR2_9FIRM|nr:anthranilate synthase component I [Orenia metallireducens]PRX28934.1 anthranilate synthase component I [Orenia metallireducens]SNY32616.1 anthranilate synthase, component I [Orenia metallireducens]